MSSSPMLPNDSSRQSPLAIPADFVNPQKLEIRLKTWFPSNDIHCYWKGGLWLVESSPRLRQLKKAEIAMLKL